MKKEKKTLQIVGSFDEIIKASVSGNPAPKQKRRKNISLKDKANITTLFTKVYLAEIRRNK